MDSVAPTTCQTCGVLLPEHTPVDMCPRCLATSTLIAASVAGTPSTWDEESETFLAGQQVGNGRFTLVEKLGQGGMGVVWLAIDNELSHENKTLQVALKFLAPRIRAEPAAMAMMREEVLQSRTLRHRHIVGVHDWHAIQGEPPFISMEYVDGLNLSQMLKQQESERRMSWSTIEPWILELCDALDYAHKEGIIHRDLKPLNLMMKRRQDPTLGPGFDLKLADFGLARVLVKDPQGSPEQTQIRGTPLYMSPQQMSGKPAKESDDIYALGVTIFELLTGTPPFHGGNIFKQVLSEPAPTISQRLAELGLPDDVPEHVTAVVASCLQKSPLDRPRSAREMARQLKTPLKETAPAAKSSWGPFLVFVVLAVVAAWFMKDKIRNWIQGEGGGGFKPPRPLSLLANLQVRAGPEPVTLSLLSASGLSLRCLTNAGSFENLPAGSYVVAASRQGYTTTNISVELKPGETLKMPPVELLPIRDSVAPSQTATRLTLRFVGPGSIEFRVVDEATRTAVLAKGTFDRQTNVAIENPPDLCRLEAYQPSIAQPRLRMNQQVPLGTGDRTIDIKFDRSTVYVPMLEKSTNISITWTDYWGASGKLDNLSYRDRVSFHVPHRDIFQGEYTYTIWWPGFEKIVVSTNVPPGSNHFDLPIQLFTRWIAPFPGFDWTNNAMKLSLVWFSNQTAQFWAAATETTIEQYRQYWSSTRTNGELTAPGIVSVGTNGWEMRGCTWQNPGFTQRDSEPVVGVSWADAVAFCHWLTTKQLRENELRPGQRYCLPTDAQWSIMAGTNTYPWGEWPPGNLVNVAGEEARTVNGVQAWYRHWPTLPQAIHGDAWERTAPANGGLMVNGLFHLGGNVAEWCDDWYRKELNSAELLKAFPLLTNDGGGEKFKVVRGGSWYEDDPDELKTPTRQRAEENYRCDRIGFRVVLLQEEPIK